MTVSIESLGETFREQPILFAGYRGLYTLANEKEIPEENTVPLLRSILFVLAILPYLIIKRSMQLVLNQTHISTDYDHIFEITSTSEYRTYTLSKVAEEIGSTGDSVLILRTPSTDNRFEDIDNVDKTITHSELHGYIQFRTIFSLPLQAIMNTRKLRKSIDSTEIPPSNFIFPFNLLLLEQIKYESMRTVSKGDPKIHTLDAMPYLLRSTQTNNIFVYQHGIQWNITGYNWPGVQENTGFNLTGTIPYYIPLTYFVWGEPFANIFEKQAHPRSKILVTGSPWYDRLSHIQSGDNKCIDVLFISQPAFADDDLQGQYEQLVNSTAGFCEENNLTFAIKLHPRETNEWYREQGLTDYIREFNDVDDALLEARVMVTNSSTAFVEASVLGTPSIVADISGLNLSTLGPIEKINFLTNIDDLENELSGALFTRNNSNILYTNNLIRLGDSAERICELVLKS
jgi:hypothetical protein